MTDAGGTDQEFFALPSWARESAAYPPDPPEDKSGWPASAVISVVALAGLLALLLAGGIGFVLGNQGDDGDDAAAVAEADADGSDASGDGAAATDGDGDADTVASGDDAAGSAGASGGSGSDDGATADADGDADTASSGSTAGGDGGGADTDGDDASDGDDTGSGDDTASGADAAQPFEPFTGGMSADGEAFDELVAGASTRRGLLEQGRLYLRGRVPSAEYGESVAAAAGAVVGQDNVVIQYEVDPEASADSRGPLYVIDLILFESGSARIGPDFVPLLELGLILFNVNDTVSVTVEGHTDDVGAATDNLALSQRRVQSIITYWTDRGVDPDRIVGVAKGESDPIADNTTSDGRARNRRIQFQINNLLG